MKVTFIHKLAIALALGGMMIPQAALAAPAPVASHQAVVVSDVALRAGGVFVGQVVDAHGAPLAEAGVSVRFAGKEVVSCTTDARGVFAAQGLRSGQYDVVAGGGQVTYRLWDAGAAPPTANNGALIVTGDEIISGQCGGCDPCGCPPGGTGGGASGALGWMKSHPLLVAAGVAAAIAIPLALADDDDPVNTPGTP
ncbi:hypothetical protein Pla175_10480 [Pirellulimonas nuda]|uniref:Nickel uptake substrate-specific transmembrane region n=1 Tax=Pirellulimonas nuda TaxID=2528009 RepID=A0A518D871_9BACT|nr:carboxypeptidase-like regulatory domain-containing protein [Pirellulimonas nuda]QDU87682.1 hypothetical protein Pla175_10480 [Pirellulimonas nuda]